MSTNRVTIEKAKKLFSKYNLELLEDEYISRTTKMKYRCPKHTEVIQYRSYQTQLACRGKCYKCAKEQASLKTKRSFIDVIEIFNKLNLDLLEINFIQRNEPMKFRCRIHKDIIQERPFDSVDRGYGCRICTQEGKSEKLSGYNSGNWKGGLTPFNEAVRTSLRGWREEILKKHNYRCYISGQTENLEVHHVKNFHEIRDEVLRELGYEAYFKKEQRYIYEFTKKEIDLIKREISERHTLNSGYPITEELHIEFHNIYGRKASKEDFYEFVEDKMR